MPTSFDQSYFLQALGWGIVNSLWQAAFAWLLLQCVFLFKSNRTALFSSQLYNLIFFSSFLWFVFTVLQYYFQTEGLTYSSVNLFFYQCQILLQQSPYLLPSISFIYLILLSFYLLQFILQWRRENHLTTAQNIKATIDLRLFVDRVSMHVGIKKNVTLWLSTCIDVPMTLGFFKPVILLPVALINKLNTKQVEAILLHELAHIRRNDFLINLLQTVVSVMLFFNPFMQMMHRAIKKERENCCDDYVLNFNYQRNDYADALLLIEENRQQSLRLALTATNNKHMLLHRIKRIVEATPINKKTAAQKIIMTLVVVPFLMAICSSFFLQTKTSIAKSALAPIEIYQPTFVANQHPENEKNNAIISTHSVALKSVASKKTSRQKYKPVLPTDYSITLVNEDLLKQKVMAEAMSIADREQQQEDKELLVKVEEEQSGNKGKNTYYYKLSNNNDQPEIKPLLINKKFKKITGKKTSSHFTKKKITS